MPSSSKGVKQIINSKKRETLIEKMGQRLNMKDGLRDRRSITLTEFVGGKFQIYK